MEENKEKKSGSFLNIPEFWMKQRKAWRITVYRTSMGAFGLQDDFALLGHFSSFFWVLQKHSTAISHQPALS